MYSESASAISGAVRWWSRADSAAVVRVLPDGCMDLLWDGRRVFVAGPDDRAQLHLSVPGQRLVGLRLAPGQGPVVLGCPADALLNERVDLDALWSAGAVAELADRLSSSQSPIGAATALEAAAGRRLTGAAADRLSAAVVELARRGQSSAEIADRTGFSARQLQRRCNASFGYGAKTLVRILRMQHALALVRSGSSAATAAALAGYADQPHLHRDVKDFAGVGLGAIRP